MCHVLDCAWPESEMCSALKDRLRWHGFGEMLSGHWFRHMYPEPISPIAVLFYLPERMPDSVAAWLA